MTHDEHKERHIELHRNLDELVADWIRHSPKEQTRLPSQCTVHDLLRWSHQQTIDPTELNDD